MNGWRWWLVLVLGGVLVVGWWWQGQKTAVSTEENSLIPLLSEETTDGFALALTPNAMTFPRDLGPHPDYQTEWWYYTGNLETADGRSFGFQFTIFRRAIRPPDQFTQTGSDWRTNQIYLAHFAVSDVANGRFYATERLSRGAIGLAGAQAEPYRVWLEDWEVAEIAPGQVRLYASTDEVTLELTLTQTMPPILHGEGGLSPKGVEPGNASYYYSIIRQKTEGVVTINGRSHTVSGLSWKDHEYSTSALSAEAIGWDWFSLQLDDGTALMLFQIRRADGTVEPASAGSFVQADGTVLPLHLGDWELEVLDTWRSPTSGAEYPAKWHIRIPALELELTGAPLMPNQELTVSTVYWEGAVAFRGERNGRAITARGYIELTGYAQSMRGRL